MSSSVLPAQILSAADAVTEDNIDFDRRFGGIARLYGAPALAGFRRANVCVIGVGGVGSWAVEALARSAIGKLTLIDLDNLAESNVNRQIHALTATLGQAKVTALADRIKQINPYCAVTEVEDFIAIDNVDQMLGGKHFDYVIDAIDDVRAKTAVIAYCRDHNIPLITIGSAGGKVDPTCIEVRDLARTEQEPLLAKVRKLLRSGHGFPRGEKSKFGIDAVFSTEPLRLPISPVSAATSDATNGKVAAAVSAPPSASASTSVTGLNCAGYGSAVVVTATFGFVAAAHVLRKLAAIADLKGALVNEVVAS
ncbi:tRNA cyclic N6-threonylcarbamoyladenosine(37) synthase TcdA [Glaciimonas immobilis]|uniref:tRNA A37 threonylcarbamoyladenosine dehydratase n=1 Tax=Glaciimonas immobilis TaxID=728004 RepID=A0A840RPH8_9BURK|nr:tRNA cyclic N6-threonylcarbamoyladenosine(37) synthase TcdA [Glaciimonas immobilis]KAF3999814.1 tRNA cyclic N6-threonylcarbamoyladenosine(37) synthase TcdA [Glaciimonas immobilis]MBB5200287.1 tRNA A37 threonylcarbamoyladenosine dehydratase [Glaciimonas immobilis]